VQIHDPLPGGLSLVSAEALDQGSCTGAVTCALGSLAPGASARVRVQATVTQMAPGDLTNTASVSGPDPDPSPPATRSTGGSY
jgi:hypothetical protein